MSGITDRSHKATVTNRPVTSLGHQRCEEFSEGGPNFTSIACTKTMVMHAICPRHLSGGGEFFQGGEALPLLTGVVTRWLGMQKSRCILDWCMGMNSERRLVRFHLDILNWIILLGSLIDVGKSTRQTMFGQSKGYPTACKGWQWEIERTNPLPISGKNKL